MSAAKRQNASSAWSEWVPRGLPWLFGPGRPVLIVLILFSLFGGGWYWAWRRVRARVSASPEYRLELDGLTITPLPKWIDRSDVRGEVFRELSRKSALNVIDEDLTQRISTAFAQHPWVAKVGSVRELPPASVRVDLVYRRPVCAVETPPAALPLPVDAESVLLPGDDFTPLELNAYPRLTGVDRVPAGLAPGRRWSDARVIGGAEIAAALQPVWEELKLQRIQPSQPRADGWTAGDAAHVPAGNSPDRPAAGWTPVQPAAAADVSRNDRAGAAEDAASRPSGEYTFWLVTRGGTNIYWGYAPGANAPGELSAADKIARLRRYVADHDSLDSPSRPQLDIRALQPATAR